MVGIDTHNIAFKDNAGLLEMILGRPLGLFSLLDEESRFPRASAATLVPPLPPPALRCGHFCDCIVCGPDLADGQVFAVV